MPPSSRSHSIESSSESGAGNGKQKLLIVPSDCMSLSLIWHIDSHWRKNLQPPAMHRNRAGNKKDFSHYENFNEKPSRKERKANGIEVSSLQFFMAHDIAFARLWSGTRVMTVCSLLVKMPFLSWFEVLRPVGEFPLCRVSILSSAPSACDAFPGRHLHIEAVKSFQILSIPLLNNRFGKKLFFRALETSFSAGTQKPPSAVSTNGLAVQRSRFLCVISADMVISSRTNCQLLFLASSFRDL